MAIFKGPVLWIVFMGLLTMGMYQSGKDAEEGKPEPEFRGRRAGLKSLLSSAGRSLGSTGSLALGGVVEAGLAAWLVVMLRNGKSSGE